MYVPVLRQKSEMSCICVFIYFASFYDFSIGFLNCLDCVIFLCFILYSLSFCFVLFFVVIVLSVLLQCTVSNYPFGIFKLFCDGQIEDIQTHTSRRRISFVFYMDKCFQIMYILFYMDTHISTIYIYPLFQIDACTY